MNQWRCPLYVFKDKHGQQYISVTVPADDDVTDLRLFQASGPYMPIGFPKPALVDDAAEWMAGLKEKGFSFTPFGSGRDIRS